MITNFIEDLRQRSALFDLTNEQGILQLPKDTSFYLGIDPTSPYLHIGNFVPMISMIRIAQYGLKPIFLFGGATGSIGDPSGRDTERTLLSREEIDRNVASHEKTVRKIFERAGCKVDFVNNYDWTKDVTVLDFLRDIGKHFSLSYIMSKDSVKSRHESAGISFTEMSYMLLQAFDFYHLFKENNCRMQVGGSDQYGNITAGLELIRKKLAHERLALRKKESLNTEDDKRDEADEAFALSFPLLTDSQGRKFGKSTGSAAWLNAEATSPYKFHQFWVNTSDADIEKYFMYFSLKGINEIREIIAEGSKAPEKRYAQNILADEMCDLVHGNEATLEAKKCAQALFGGDIKSLKAEQLEDVFADVPSYLLSKVDLEKQELTITDLFVNSGLLKTKSEVRRLITDGGAYLNGERVSDANQKLNNDLLIEGRFGVLRSGKKNYAVVKVG